MPQQPQLSNVHKVIQVSGYLGNGKEPAINWPTVEVEFKYMARICEAAASEARQTADDSLKFAMTRKMIQEIEKTLIIIRTIIS